MPATHTDIYIILLIFLYSRLDKMLNQNSLNSRMRYFNIILQNQILPIFTIHLCSLHFCLQTFILFWTSPLFPLLKVALSFLSSNHCHVAIVVFQDHHWTVIVVLQHRTFITVLQHHRHVIVVVLTTRILLITEGLLPKA